MIQAIVFLPLIGAILAGLIAIFGAHARNPSGDTVEHHDDAHGADAHASDAHRMPMTARRSRPRRPSRRRAAGRGIARGRTDHHRPAADRRGAVLVHVRRCRLHASRRPDRAVPVDHLGRSAGRVVAAGRYADRRDAGGGQHGVVARASLFDRLHGRGSEPAAVLCLSVAVHLRDADAGDRRTIWCSCSSAGKASASRAIC